MFCTSFEFVDDIKDHYGHVVLVLFRPNFVEQCKSYKTIKPNSIVHCNTLINMRAFSSCCLLLGKIYELSMCISEDKLKLWLKIISWSGTKSL